MFLELLPSGTAGNLFNVMVRSRTYVDSKERMPSVETTVIAMENEFALEEKTKSLLTPSTDVIRCHQQTRQASVLRGTLKSGGFLFSGPGGAL